MGDKAGVVQKVSMEEVEIELDIEDCFGKMRIALGRREGRKTNRAGSCALFSQCRKGELDHFVVGIAN